MKVIIVVVGAAAGLGALAAIAPLAVVLVIGSALGLAIALKGAKALPPVLLLAAVPLVRPNILGEYFSPVGFTLVSLAAIIALTESRGRIALFEHTMRPLRSACFWLGIAYLWLVLRIGFLGYRGDAIALVQGAVLTVGTVVAAAVVLADERRRLVVGRGFVVLVALASASYVLTAGIWLVAGIGAGQIGTMQVGAWEPQPLFVPFTPTAGQLTIFGLGLPRFTGFGREPGWMAMYAAFAYFLAARVGWNRWWLKALLISGLLGCVSTAGFGVFVVAWTYEAFLRRRASKPSLYAYSRQVAGVVVMAGAVYLAIAAPGLGLNAKSDVNGQSWSERLVATEAGWEALWSTPFGGGAAQGVGGVNLIAAVAAAGLPFVLAVMAALWTPQRSHPARRLSTAMIAVLAMTLLTSQPAADSTWVFVLAVLAYAVTMPGPGATVPTRDELPQDVGSRAG